MEGGGGFQSHPPLPCTNMFIWFSPKISVHQITLCIYIYFVRKLFHMALGDKGKAISKEVRLTVTSNLPRQVQEKFGLLVPCSTYVVPMQ